jgi:GWxTD domain-containing protein
MDMETTGWSAGARDLSLRRSALFLLMTPFLFLLIWSGSLAAQEFERLPFFLDTASFQALGDTGKSYVEMYILLSSKSLKFQEEGGEHKAYLEVQGTIRDREGQEKWRRQWRKEILVSKAEGLERGSSILDIAGLILEPDFYTLRVDLKDELSGDTGSVTGRLDVLSFPSDTLFISEVELALDITASQEEGDFVKSGIRVLPNPARIYGPKAPVLYFYVEIYGLLLGVGLDSTYTIQQEVLTLSGNSVKEYEPKSKRKPGRTCVEVGGINVLGLAPDTYIFRIRVRDNASGGEIYSQRWFRVTSPAEEISSAPPVSIVLTPEEAEHQHNLIKYVATKQELNVYKELNLEGKARFLEDFWSSRDPNWGTPQNEFQEEHLRRWDYASRQFSQFELNDGWKSDQGRVYIIYGPPDDIERHSSDVSSVAWESWHYFSLEGGIMFIFADLGGFDNFVLLHSDARNEFHDRSWRQKIRRTPYAP